MPVLDTCCWMGEESREEGLNPNMIPGHLRSKLNVKSNKLQRVILYCFYKKPMANKSSNMAKSAMPEQQKMSMTSQEIQRRCRNTSRDLPKEILDRVLQNYMDELKLGGYSLTWRVKALDAGTKGFCKVWNKEKLGTGHINRP